MNTIILPMVFQNITIITIIIYCKKKQICRTTGAISPLPHCLVYACTFFFRRTNSFSQLLILITLESFFCSSIIFLKLGREWGRWWWEGEKGRKKKKELYASMRQMSRFADIAGCCVWRWDAISGSGLPAWFRHHVRFCREYSLTSTWVRRRWIFRISCSAGVAWQIKHSPVRQLSRDSSAAQWV